MSHNKEEVIAYRLAKANEDIVAAKILARSASWNGVNNRLYYSAFHAVSALLKHLNIAFNSHAGAKAMFELHVVKPGNIDKQWSKFYTRLMENRNESDYEDFVVFDADDVLPLIPQTAGFIELIKSLIHEK